MRFLISAVLLNLGTALYTPSDDVVELTAGNFDQKVVKSDKLWIVEFYAPWCGHCKSLAPEYIKFARTVKGYVNVGAVDMDVHSSVGGPYGIRGFPTIKIFGANKSNPSDYNGARTAQGLANESMDLLKKMVLSGKGSSGGGKSSGGSKSGGKSGGKGTVVELTDSSFKAKVLESKELWMVEFFAPWCGHCQRLEPEWKKAAAELSNSVKLGALDATVHTQTAQKYNIRGYPSIKIFHPDGKVEDYQGGRTADDIITAAQNMAAAIKPAPELRQLTSPEAFSEACGEVSVCVMAFLPHILDDTAAGRNDRLKMIKDIIDKYKAKTWGWVWTVAGSQGKLAEAVGVSSYPTLVIVNIRKKIAVKMTTGFHAKGLDEFLRYISVGKTTNAVSQTFEEMPELSTEDPWDGKDGELPVEDDYDLDDFDWGDEEEEAKEEL